jgi:hypothetical protein
MVWMPIQGPSLSSFLPRFGLASEGAENMSGGGTGLDIWVEFEREE